MTVFDTDVFSEILAGADEYVQRAAMLPAEERCITVVTVDEILRGALAEVRRAESGRHRGGGLPSAYERLGRTVAVLTKWTILSYSPAADARLQAWKSARVPVKPHDLRIAAICVAGSLTLVTRNRRDFERVPGLEANFWA